MSYYCYIITPEPDMRFIRPAKDVRYYILNSTGFAMACDPSVHYEYSGKYSINLRYKSAPDVAVTIGAPSLRAVLCFLSKHLVHCISCSFGFFGKYSGDVPERSWESFDKDRRAIGWII